ncbi:hypothetical protein LZK98_04525 [Sphingomonas cannabina]|uniref:CC0125/CC1285 family lipoprotein n=1 Tax=Sphingomonas cannabina TaxID=2899123 RepID=UPI001F3767C1|nr:hypothetical protein [Sphingomonas cannabina]UIJ46218.1 hypothetical protein LZK98_04525 [Sphingomonas cannabina]
MLVQTMRSEFLTPAIAALLLMGCSSTTLRYQRETAGGGYAEQRIGDDRYRVTYTAPPRTHLAVVDRLALRRAAELALAKGFYGFVVADRAVVHDVYVLPTTKGGRVTYRGSYRDWRRFWRFYCIGRGWDHCESDPLWPSGDEPRPHIEVSYTVAFTNSPGDEVIDARTLLGMQGAGQAHGPK